MAARRNAHVPQIRMADREVLHLVLSGKGRRSAEQVLSFALGGCKLKRRHVRLRCP